MLKNKSVKIILCSLMIVTLTLSCFSSLFDVPHVRALVRRGDRGSEVTQVQQALKNKGYSVGVIDGVFGSNTEKAVKSFQSDQGLVVDGIVGNKTLAALGLIGTGYLKMGSRGIGVTAVQEALNKRGYSAGVADGIFGVNTEKAVKAFQRDQGLVVDGIVGSATYSALDITPPSGGDSGGSSGGGSISNDEKLLARIINAESRGEPYLGQVAVGAVIMNRVDHPSFPNTVSGVIYQPGAFSSLNDGNFDKPIEDSCYRAAAEVMAGSDPTGGAIYFYDPRSTTNAFMLARPVLIVIGNHKFCS